MADKSYQFIYRYVYKDDSRSVWSDISDLTPTGYLDEWDDGCNAGESNGNEEAFYICSFKFLFSPRI